MSAPKTVLLRLALHGLQIDIQSREGLVVDLVVRAEKKNSGLIGRIRQHLAHALRRAADACDTGDHHGAIGVTEVVVFPHAGDDVPPKGAHPRVFKRLPSHGADGETHYQALAIHEGVVDGIDDILAKLGIKDCRRVGADDLHSASLSGLAIGHAVILPDADTRGCKECGGAGKWRRPYALKSEPCDTCTAKAFITGRTRSPEVAA